MPPVYGLVHLLQNAEALLCELQTMTYTSGIGSICIRLSKDMTFMVRTLSLFLTSISIDHFSANAISYSTSTFLQRARILLGVSLCSAGATASFETRVPQPLHQEVSPIHTIDIVACTCQVLQDAARVAASCTRPINPLTKICNLVGCN